MKTNPVKCDENACAISSEPQVKIIVKSRYCLRPRTDSKDVKILNLVNFRIIDGIILDCNTEMLLRDQKLSKKRLFVWIYKS